MIDLLLIEDDVIDQRAFLRAFTAGRWQVSIAASIHEAQHLLQNILPDIVIADYMVGDGTALDVVGKYPVPMIVITGMGDEAVAVQALKAGAYDYLVKDTERRYLDHLPKAIENALRHHHLEQQEKEQRAFASALHSIAATLTSTLDLEEVFKRILRAVQDVVPHDSAGLLLLDASGSLARMHLFSGWQDPADQAIIGSLVYEIEKVGYLQDVYTTHHAAIISDTQLHPDWKPIPELTQLVRSCVVVPIYLAEQVIGFLSVDGWRPGQFTPTHAARLQAVAHHAAIAIQNARLYDQSSQLAALEERQRLARDLHDSVTQTLFSANVVAQSLLRLWERDPTGARDDLAQLAQLTQGALAEMRTLLLELRPQALIETDLGTLITQLAETIKGRSRLEVDVFSQGTSQLPPEVHIAFFRIAQEALNNIIKHAQASQVHIELLRRPHRVDLRVADDGRGFDPQADYPNHHGLCIMHERAAAAGVQLSIESQPTQGTSVTLLWKRR